MKTKENNYIYWSSLPNYFAALLVSYWFIRWTLASHHSMFQLWNFRISKWLHWRSKCL